MHSFFRHRAAHYLLLAIAALPLFFWNLGGATLWDLDEGRNGPCALEMRAADNWIVPTFNGALRDHKPVLLYWLQMIAFDAIGVSETAVRLPSALAALLTLFVAYELGRAMFSKSTGLIAALAAGTTPLMIGAGRFANPDALLNLFATLTMLLAWRAIQRPGAWTSIALGAACGLAVLAKGPVGLVLPAGVVALFVLWERRWDVILDRRNVWAVVSFLVVALPWYILVAVITHGHFLRGFFGKHNVDRFLSTMENHGGSPLYYPIVLVVGSAPWSLFAAAGIWAAFWSCWRTPPDGWRAACDAAADRTGRGGVPAYRFLIAWIGLYIVFFSISATKLPNYILPALVPWTLLIARFLDRWRRDAAALPGWQMRAAIAGVALVGVGIAVGLIVVSGAAVDVLRHRSLPALLPFAWLGLLPLAAAGTLVWTLRRQRRGEFVAALVVTATMLLSPLAAFATAALNGVKAPAAIAQTAAGRTDVDLRVVGLEVAHLPSLNFYLRRDIAHVQSLDEAIVRLELPYPTYVLLPESLAEILRSRAPDLVAEVARFPDLYRGRPIVMLANKMAR